MLMKCNYKKLNWPSPADMIAFIFIWKILCALLSKEEILQHPRDGSEIQMQFFLGFPKDLNRL